MLAFDKFVGACLSKFFWALFLIIFFFLIAFQCLRWMRQSLLVLFLPCLHLFSFSLHLFLKVPAQHNTKHNVRITPHNSLLCHWEFQRNSKWQYLVLVVVRWRDRISFRFTALLTHFSNNVWSLHQLDSYYCALCVMMSYVRKSDMNLAEWIIVSGSQCFSAFTSKFSLHI